MSKCLAAKYKALGRYAKSAAGRRAKAAKKGVVDVGCSLAARAKLEKAFEKAERRETASPGAT